MTSHSNRKLLFRHTHSSDRLLYANTKVVRKITHNNNRILAQKIKSESLTWFDEQNRFHTASAAYAGAIWFATVVWQWWFLHYYFKIRKQKQLEN